MKDWRFRYHWNPMGLTAHRRVPPYPSLLFYPFQLSEWLTARGVPTAVNRRFLPRETPRPVRKEKSHVRGRARQ